MAINYRKIVILLKLKFYLTFWHLYLRVPVAGTQTHDLRIMSWIFYHCATGAQPPRFKLRYREQ